MAPTGVREEAARGARILRAVYETTPEQTIHFNSVIASSDGDICYFARTTDARQTPELVFAFFERGAKGLRYNLELGDVQGVCDGPGSYDFTAFVEDAMFSRRARVLRLRRTEQSTRDSVFAVLPSSYSE